MVEKSLLRIIREQRRETLLSIAKKLHMGVTTYYYIETGERSATVDEVKNICSILKIKPKEAKDIFLPCAFTVSKRKAEK